jgi:phosphatidylglycerophosphatase A
MPTMQQDFSSGDGTTLGGRAAVWVATGLGLGLVAPAPGTVAGLWGLLLVPAVAWLPNVGAEVAAIAVLMVVAVALCGAAASALGASGDPGAIVLDEIVVLPVVFVGVPSLTWTCLIAGYVLFRLFDIWKPGLVREAERLPGGWGVVADDLAAALLAWVALRGLIALDRWAEWGWLAATG